MQALNRSRHAAVASLLFLIVPWSVTALPLSLRPPSPDADDKFGGIAAGPAEEPAPRVFYIVDTLVGRAGLELQETLRQTWLSSVRALGHDYRFFLFEGAPDDGGGNSDGPATDTDPRRADMVLVPVEFRPVERMPREFVLLRFAFSWALNHTSSEYIVKADHDMFVCPYHLSRALRPAPRERFFMGYYWDSTPLQQGLFKLMGLYQTACRADQDFLIYSRDVVNTTLKQFGRAFGQVWHALPSNGKNWALNWGMLARHLWANGKLVVVNDNMRIDSHQANLEAIKLVDHGASENYCAGHLGMHVNPKMQGTSDVRPSEVMLAMWTNRGHQEGSSSAFLTLDSGDNGSKHLTEGDRSAGGQTVGGALLGPPACFQALPPACVQEWAAC